MTTLGAEKSGPLREVLEKNQDKEILTKKQNGYSLKRAVVKVELTVSTQLLKPNFCVSLPHLRSTAVSLETHLFDTNKSPSAVVPMFVV